MEDYVDGTVSTGEIFISEKLPVSGKIILK